MSLNLTIAGASQTAARRARAGSIEIDDPINERSTASFEIMSVNGGYRPAVGADVLISDGAITAFGGEILSTEEQSFGNNIKLLTRVDCVGFDVYADRVLVTETIAPGQTLFQILTTLVAYVAAAPYSVILDPAQENPGPTIVDGFTWDHKPLSECLSDVSGVTGYVRKTNALRRLRMWAPGDILAPAPFDTGITDANTHSLRLSVTRTRGGYVNRVYVRGGSGTLIRTQTWTADGSQTTFVADVPAAAGAWYAGYCDVDGIHVPIGLTGIDAMPWTWDPATHILTNTAEWPGTGVGFPPAVGTVVDLTYTAQYPFTIMEELTGSPSDILTYGLRELVLDKPDIFDLAQARTLALETLAAQDPDRQTLELETRESGLASGQRLTVNVSLRDIDDAFLLTNVKATVDDNGVFRYVAEMEGGNVFRGSYLDTYRQWGLLGGGGGGALGGPVAINTRPGMSPVWLGGSRDVAEGVVADAWTPIRDYQEFWLRGEDWPQARVRVVVAAPSATEQVTARFYNLTTSTAIATGTPVVGTTWTEQAIPVVLTTGWNKYRLELLGEAAP